MRLDVGCGSSHTGDVNCDLMIEDSDEKWDRVASRIPNFVKADVKHLPFRTEVFQVVFCSHLLEHLVDYNEGLKELLRVSCFKLIVVLPFALFSIFDIFVTGRKFGKHRRWLKKHHKHNFLMDPLKTGCFQLRFINLKYALFEKEKVYSGLLKIPIPFETLTVIYKNDIPFETLMEIYKNV